MSHPTKFFFEFKQTVEFVLSQVSGVSLRDFVRLYDYDDFLQGEALQCESPRELANAFAARFLSSVSAAYLRALSYALVRFLARRTGASVGEADKAAIKALAEIEPKDPSQLEMWMNAYFRDVV